MTQLFISHSSKEGAFVRDLRAALADQEQEGWIDSRELRGGDPLWPEIQKAIEAASAFAVVVSPDALQSKWVGKELRYALEVQKQRGKKEFPVIPLSLNSTTLGVLEEIFGEEPIYIPVSSDAGGIEAALNPLLVALGKRISADVPATAQPKAEPLEELVLELTDLKFHEQEGVRRASARARLAYEPATLGQREITGAQSWRLIAPIDPIETDELRWYLEKYAIWPSDYFKDRAREVEANLVKWGQLLHKAAMPADHTANVMNAWARIGDHARRRFSVSVDATLEAGALEADVKAAREVATRLLALPWELLHDGDGYLFQGAKPIRVRRRLPNTKVLDVAVVATPVRILLVTARPEDESCSYLDHRVSALPLVDAMESLPGLVKIHVLNPPTLPALRMELDRARNEGHPYHVVHFDGHGVFDRGMGLGGLCFEKPEDTVKLQGRRHVMVFTTELGPLLRDHRIPLVFLEACESAQAENGSESVASELLKVGVASIVAMTHSVLVETTRRFVEAFYKALANGKRVGDAMLAGQRELKDDTFRGRVFGAEEMRLEDWFVPVLFQERDDPQLFKITPAKQTREDFQAALAARLGDLPSPPETDFVGRSRELLAIQRLLRDERYAVVRGQGGEGKTALAAEFARWMVRSQQIHRAAFVSVETHGNHRAVLDAIGKQLVQREFSAAGDLEKAIHRVEQTLREASTLLVIDNMESVLLPPFMAAEIPETLLREAAEELTAILELCKRLLKEGDTRVIFTSREVLPAPFHGVHNRRELYQLDRDDAVKFVERVLNVAGDNAGSSGDAAQKEIEELVDAVHCHARTLSLLAPSLRHDGVEATRESLVQIMIEMEKNFPGNREKSLFASVELSLRRMSVVNQDRVRILGVFHGAVNLYAPRHMMGWQEADVFSLADELVETGLATRTRANHLTLDPAVCPYLRGRMGAEEGEKLTARWAAAMLEYVGFLRHDQSQDVEVAATLTSLDLPNLLALLDHVHHAADATVTIHLATSLYNLTQALGKPRLLERLVQVRDMAARGLGDAWDQAHFQLLENRIDEHFHKGHTQEALRDARRLLQHAENAGAHAYQGADYDLAMAYYTIGRVLNINAGWHEALPLLKDARQRFGAIVENYDGDAEIMAAKCLSDEGDCLRNLGRLDEAAETYEERIRRGKQLGDARGVASCAIQLGTVHMFQGHYGQALQAFVEARDRFDQLNEPHTVAVCWHQMGIVYQQAEEPEAAEDAYRNSLTIEVQVGNIAGQAESLAQLGILYDEAFGRLEGAVSFFRDSVKKYSEIEDMVGEGRIRNYLALALLKLGRLDEARQEIGQAMQRNKEVGDASQMSNTWAILADIETRVRNVGAATNAKRKAIDCYLAYRRDGGENQNGEEGLSFDIGKLLVAGEITTAASLLQQLIIDPGLPRHWLSYIRALQAIVAGSRDRTLGDAPDLNIKMATEILFLIETLEKRG